jgi:hypothetical protein
MIVKVFTQTAYEEAGEDSFLMFSMKEGLHRAGPGAEGAEYSGALLGRFAGISCCLTIAAKLPCGLSCFSVLVS